jgi:amidase
VVKRIEDALGAAAVVDAAPGGFDDLYWAFRRLQAREAWEEHGAMIERYRPPLGPGVAERFAYGKAVTEAEVSEAAAERARFREAILGTLDRDGVLLLPTMPDVAPPLVEDEASLDEYRNQALRLLCLAGLSGLPQVTMPLASRLDAPLGISLIGPPGSDVSLARLAARLAA